MAIEHWLTLSLADGIGPIIGRRIIEACGSVEAASDATAAQLRQIEGIGASKASSIADSIAESKSKSLIEIESARNKGIGFICAEDESYPHLLTEIPNPPLVMYIKGKIEPRDLNSIAIVGSRKCSLYGREQAERFAQLLAGAGFTIISGGARGVDSVSHRGALSHRAGRTIAVLGSGLDVPYPPENVELFQQIAERGAVLSEYPLGTPPLADNFPRRNRIVSGMSRGVLVIEADERSGALITARQAADEQNRPVMAIPGRVDNPQSAGPHKLIRDGAMLVTRIEHILEALGPLNAAIPEPSLYEAPDEPEVKINRSAPATRRTSNLSDSQQTILDSLSVDPMDIDTITEQTSLDVSVVLQDLTFLTLKGRARRVNGQQYVKVV